jgi:hypothetical protein
MLLDIKDLITGRVYTINSNQICFFTKDRNEFGVNRYQIHLTNGFVITTVHKRWTRIKRSMGLPERI